MNAPPHQRNLREAHAHIAAHGRAMSMPDLSRCGSVGECLDRLRDEAARTATGGWVLAFGARIEGWREARWPTLEELDGVGGGRPVVVRSFDHHGVCANVAAMAAGGIDEGTRDPAGGVICRDAKGARTGVLLEMAASQVWNAAPEPGPAERRAHVMAALVDLARHGFVEVHDLLAQPWLGPVLAEIDGAEGLPVRVGLFVPAAELKTGARGRRAWERDRVRLLGAKLFADGTLNSRTALMLSEYADPLPGMPRGKAMLERAEIEGTLRACREVGVGLAVHAIGDGAVRMVLEAVERVGDGSNGDVRIEHAEIVDREDVVRIAGLGVVASVQPCHLLYDIEVLRRALPHRLDRVLPLREMIGAGLVPGKTLLFGSDVPIVRPHPGDSVQAAVFRRREGMTAEEAIAPEQALTSAEAWACFG